MDELETVDACARYLVIKLCVETNATEAAYTLEEFRKGETVLGNYKVTVEKLPN